MAAPKAKTPKKSKSVGRPKQHPAIRFARAFKTHATGETKNSPTTVPNIIFFLGLFLIVTSGFKSGRFPKLLSDIWNTPGVAGTVGTAGGDILQQFRVILLQLLWLFATVVTARFIPPLSRPLLIILVGMTILYFMNNPQVLQWLNAQEQQAQKFSGTSNTSSNSTAQSLTAQQLTKTQQDLQNVIKARLAGARQ